jgi:MFS family permease
MADLDDEAPLAGPDRPAPGFFRSTRDSVASVFRNPNLRRVQLAYVGSSTGDFAYATAVAVWAYGVGGATAVGIWMSIRLLLSAVVAPFTGALADRVDRKRLMICCDLARVILVTGSAVCLIVGTPAWPIFVLATLTALFQSPFMLAQRTLMPNLADTPDELTAANGAQSTIESLACFVGPALGALLLTVSSVEVVFLVEAATFLWSMSLVVRVTPRDRVPAEETDHDDEGVGFFREAMAGFPAIASDRGLLLATVATSLQTIVSGASAVFVVVLADDLLRGPTDVGYLDAVLGVGAILGGALAIGRSTRHRLAVDMTIGVVLWSAPLALITVWPHPVAAFAAMALLGLGNPLVDVNLDTIIQRLTPDAMLGRVFGALETCFVATMALGALVMPYLIDWLGLRWSLIAVAAPVALLALVMLPQMRLLDGRLRPPALLPLISAIDMFAPLAPATKEFLARSLGEERFTAGDVLVREGDESDLFYVIESGLVEVTQGDRVLRREGPGEYFGEIGLLRDVPRTATITAVEATVVRTLARRDFLDAVSGHHESRLLAEDVASRRLAV